MADRNSADALADRLFPPGQEEDFSESILSIPPEQRRLHTETYDFTIGTLIEQVKAKHIFIPEFQRRYVWSQAQASRLIESLIIQCPIPVVYLNQEADERLSVIDGNQRIKSLQRYLDNQFDLRGLTAYPELEGKHFFELDPRFQRHITNRTMRCIVIAKDTHPQVKFDVFERLNTGAVKLTAQELRHGIYFGKLMKLCTKLATAKKWHPFFAVDSNKRMRLEEFILRFFAMHYGLKEYKKPLSSFLNQFADSNRDLSKISESELSELFDRMMTGISATFSDLAFKVFDANLTVQSKFNVALFDAETLAISQHPGPIQELSPERRRALYTDMAKLFTDDEFAKAITRATSDENAIKVRVEKVTAVVKKYI